VRPRGIDGLVSAELTEGETVVSLPATGSALVLNGTGSAVLDLCDGRHTVAEIAGFICDVVTGADPAQVERDVAALIDRLADAGLVEDADACGSPSAG
jgi:pyrroloquinoline quinone biosynthesis protein D